VGVPVADEQVEDGAPHHLPQGVVVLSTVGEGREGLDRGLVLAVPRAEAPEDLREVLNVYPASRLTSRRPVKASHHVGLGLIGGPGAFSEITYLIALHHPSFRHLNADLMRQSHHGELVGRQPRESGVGNLDNPVTALTVRGEHDPVPILPHREFHSHSGQGEAHATSRSRHGCRRFD